MKIAPVTLVIPHRNRAYDIQRNLKSFQNLKTIPQEIIIVDDFSKPDQRRLLRDILFEFKNLNIKLFFFREHLGTSNAKNLGLINTQTPYIWFLDSDTEIINTDTLEIGCQILDQNPAIGVLGTEIVKDRNNQHHIREQYLLKNLWSAFIYHPIKKVFQKEVDFISSCNFLTRTKLINEIGGFHNKLESGEDKLACIQIQKLNYKILLDTRFAVLHHQSLENRKDFLTRARIKFRDDAFIYGTTSNIWKLLLLNIIFIISMPEFYKNTTKIYRQYGNAAAINSKDTWDTSRSFNPINLIGKFITLGKIMLQYFLANKTYMAIKGYYYNKKNKRNFQKFVCLLNNIHLEKLCNKIDL